MHREKKTQKYVLALLLFSITVQNSPKNFIDKTFSPSAPWLLDEDDRQWVSTIQLQISKNKIPAIKNASQQLIYLFNAKKPLSQSSSTSWEPTQSNYMYLYQNHNNN